MFLESVIRPLLLLHALIAVTLLGSVGHLGWECLHYLMGRARNVWLGTVHARVGFALYTANFLLGLAIYPTYRVRVRQEFFDIRMPWATNLFDTKEFLAAFGMAAFAALFLASFAVDPRDENDRAMLPTFAGLGLLVASITIYCAVVGLTLVTYKAP